MSMIFVGPGVLFGVSSDPIIYPRQDSNFARDYFVN
jgi:hypothetical protein